MLPASGSPRSMKRLIKAPSSSTATRVSYGSTLAISSLVISTPVSTGLESNLFPSHAHVQQQAGRPHHRHQGAAAVTDERERNAGDRHQPQCHPDVDEQVKRNHPDHPHGHQHPQTVFCLGRSEEHTSELQSLTNIVCRLVLYKK